MKTDAYLERAEALATRHSDCPACLADTWWPSCSSALEATCDCWHVLRLEPDGTLFDLGVVEAVAGSDEPAPDPHDLEAL